MDRLPDESDDSFLQRLVDLSTEGFSDNKLGVLAARIRELSRRQAAFNPASVAERAIAALAVKLADAVADEWDRRDEGSALSDELRHVRRETLRAVVSRISGVFSMN